MAGFYLIIDKPDNNRTQNALKAITNFDDEYSEIISEDYFNCICTSVNDKTLWGNAFDPDSGIRVIIAGRIHLSQQEWNEAKKLLSFDGGIAGRYIIKKYLDNDINSIYKVIGPAVIIIWNPRSKSLEIINDHFGYYPVFVFRNNKNEIKIISSSPDSISKDTSVNVTKDELSFVEFLSAWRITPPNTYYNEIKYLGCAKHITCNLSENSCKEKEYWRPFQNSFYDNFDLASRNLESALRDSIGNITLPELGPVVNFTSGGMDSRAVLYCANERNSLIAFNMYDEPNFEASVAQQLCKECGVRYLGYPRDNDYYPRLIKDIVKVNEGMNPADDQHYLGVKEIVKALGAKTVISGCSTDWLFKGYGLEKEYIKFLGKNLPVTRLKNKRVDAFLPNYPNPVPEEYQKKIKERLLNWFGDVPTNFEKDIDWLLVEDKRIRPTLYAPSISGPSMYRIFPYDTFLASSVIADVYGKMPAKWKINSTIWSKTVSRIGGKAGKVIDANSGSKMGISLPHRLYDFGRGWIKRHLIQKNKSVNDKLATDYSWPNFGWYIRNSKTINKIWSETEHENKKIISGYLGYNPWDLSLDYWSKNHNDFFRILTILIYLQKDLDDLK